MNLGDHQAQIALIGAGPSSFAASKVLEIKGAKFVLFNVDLSESDAARPESHGPQLSRPTRKLLNGSTLPYRNTLYGNQLQIDSAGPTGITRNFINGGFSMVWGATMLPFPNDVGQNEDFTSNLNEFYQFISHQIPISGFDSALSNDYPQFSYTQDPLIPSSRFLAIIQNSETISTAEEDFLTGSASLAVHNIFGTENSCNYCGKCITACPKNLIWNSKKYFSSLNGSHIADVIKKVRVEKIEKSTNGLMTIVGINIQDGESVKFGPFKKILLATGPLETFSILSRSLIIGKETELADSQMIYLIFFTFRKSIGSSAHTLSQAFARIKTRDSSFQPIHLQLYEYSEDVLNRARELSPVAKILPVRLLRFILRRCVFAIGYLDSRDSGTIRIRLLEDSSLEAQGMKMRQGDRKLVLKKIGRYARKNGWLPLKFLARFGTPGESIHYGANLYGKVDSDTHSTIQDWKDLHILDSSVLPFVPAGPITFTVMANSARIVSGLNL